MTIFQSAGSPAYQQLDQRFIALGMARCRPWIEAYYVRFIPKRTFSPGQPNVRYAPCVDGSPLARVFLMLCASVGAAMCSACLCGTQRPLAIMPSAKTGPGQKHALEALWR